MAAPVNRRVAARGAVGGIGNCRLAHSEAAAGVHGHTLRSARAPLVVLHHVHAADDRPPLRAAQRADRLAARRASAGRGWRTGRTGWLARWALGLDGARRVTAAGAACHDPYDDYGQHRNHDTNCSTPWHGSHSRQVPQVLPLQPGYFALPSFPRNQFSAYPLNRCGPFGQRASGHVDELEAGARNTIPRVRRHCHVPHRYPRVSAEAP